MNGKSPDAFRTISEVAEWLGVNTHVLRFWESKFAQVKPVKRAGGRRYYRRSDMELLGGIQKLLREDGMTIKGVQKVLRDQGVKAVAAMSRPVDAEDATSETDAPVVDEVEAIPVVEATAEIAPEVDEPSMAPAAVETPQKPVMPLFSHREDEVTPGSGPADGPVVAPLPSRDIPLVEALSLLRPMQIAPERLAPIHARLVALRERMDAAG